ncbi:MAG: DEAD/DEAH box helicase family protein, partial [Psychrosphaera sp.]|nr:DEAD/DEAH box helicase family protein [Psychrosphaera sp.]
YEVLADALRRKAKINLLTGDYLYFTSPAALRLLLMLKEQGADVRIFESGQKQSFHMKAYLFVRAFSNGRDQGCAFVGSSNITKMALRNGLEWNLCVDRQEDEARFIQILSQFDTLFKDPRCKTLSNGWINDYQKRIPERAKVTPGLLETDEPVEVPTPNPIQVEALAALAQTRAEGYRRGLVVLATGLGKTWLAAFDCAAVNAQRILFVAHREEILEQAEKNFLTIKTGASAGYYNGKTQQLDADMLFASVQTIGRTNHLNKFAKDHFDYIIVDEFHHAAARTYKQLLAHFTPQFLLGLTATPDRTDQVDILSLCDDNEVFRKELFEGIESKQLCPFNYFGIYDEAVDYQEIKWRNGKFDPAQLFNQLATVARAKHNFDQWQKHRQQRTLAFCISRKHADFMANYFNNHGVKAISVHSESKVQRKESLKKLEEAEVDIIFSVDLFNEGVDLPAIDTVLMLRPTESAIIFLQQLGRGLRTFDGKDKLIVLDFIGNHISFFRKVTALFKVGASNKARNAFAKNAKNQTLELPDGCFVNYDIEVIEFMEKLTATRFDQQAELYQSLKEMLGRRPSLPEFVQARGGLDAIRKEP